MLGYCVCCVSFQWGLQSVLTQAALQPPSHLPVWHRLTRRHTAISWGPAHHTAPALCADRHACSDPPLSPPPLTCGRREKRSRVISNPLLPHFCQDVNISATKTGRMETKCCKDTDGTQMMMNILLILLLPLRIFVVLSETSWQLLKYVGDPLTFYLAP